MLTVKQLAEKLPGALVDETPTHVNGDAPPDVRGQALDLWRVAAPEDASKHDFLFGLAMLRLGSSEARVRELLPQLPAGKMRRDSRGEDYWRATLESIHRAWKEEERARKVVAGLKSKDAFLPESLVALALVRDSDRGLYEKCLRRIKKRVRIAKLEAEIGKEVARLRSRDLDGVARCVSDGKKIAGWWLRLEDRWTGVKFAEFRAILDGMGLPSAPTCAELSKRPWELVNIPFGEAEDRKWNKDAAKLAFEAVKGPHPTWDQLLRVVGRGLSGAASSSAWCAENGADGGRYLFLWCASLLQRPTLPLPYLFLFGEQQDAGKSSLHEALALLMEPGYCLANEALENKNGFNGELAGAILCAADEIELTKKSYKRIKQWTTGEWLLVHPKGGTAYKIRNTCHFIQTGNARSDCALLRGDTRITAFEVWRSDAEDKMAKDEMFRRLKAEAPAFLWSALEEKLPEPMGRLGVPILETHSKLSQQAATLSELETWCERHPEWLAMTDEELCKAFLGTVGGQHRHEWDENRVIRELPGVDWARRTLLALRKVSEGGPWQGQVKDLFKTLHRVELVSDGHICDEATLGLFLSRPLPRLAVGRSRSKRGSQVRLTWT